MDAASMPLEGGDPGARFEEDVRLAQAALAGSIEAQERFAARMQCVPRILQARNRRLGRPFAAGDLDDVMQESLFLIWRGLAGFSGWSSLETWAYRCCNRVLAQRLRERRSLLARRVDLLTVESAQGEDGPRTFEAVYAALDKLEPDEAAVIRLKHFEDMTFEEIGQEMSISPNTAKTRYYRGVGRLEKFLGASNSEVAS